MSYLNQTSLHYSSDLKACTQNKKLEFSHSKNNQHCDSSWSSSEAIMCQVHHQIAEHLCTYQNKPLCRECIREKKQSSSRFNIVTLKKGLEEIKFQMQQQISSFQQFIEQKNQLLSRTISEPIVGKNVSRIPDNVISLFYQSNQEFEDAHRSMMGVLRLYDCLNQADQVQDIAHYLESFKVFMIRANEAEIVLKDILDSSKNAPKSVFIASSAKQLQYNIGKIKKLVIKSPKFNSVERQSGKVYQNFNNFNVIQTAKNEQQKIVRPKLNLKAPLKQKQRRDQFVNELLTPQMNFPLLIPEMLNQTNSIGIQVKNNPHTHETSMVNTQFGIKQQIGMKSTHFGIGLNT